MSVLALAVLLVPVAQSAPSEGFVTERYDLRRALAAETWWIDWIDLRRPLASSTVRTVYLEDESSVLGLDDAPEDDRLEDAFGQYVRSIRAGNVGRATLQDGWLEVVAPPEVQTEVRNAVSSLDRTTRQQVTVDALWIPRHTSGLAPSGLLSPEEAEALFASAAPDARGWARARFGEPVRLGRPSVEMMVYDHWSDVTDGPWILDPLVMWLPEGAALGVRVDRPAIGEKLVVRTWGRESRPIGTPRRLTIGGAGGTEVDLPRVESAVFGASGRLESGGALVVDTADTYGHLVVVRVTTLPLTTAADDPIVQLGALGAPRHRFEPCPLPWPAPSRGLDMTWPDEPVGFAPWIDQPTDPVGEAARRLELTGHVASWRLGPGALVAAEPDIRARVRAEVGRIALENFGSTVVVEMASGGLRPHDVGALITDPSALSTFAEAAELRMTGATLEGDTLFLRSGEERAYLADYDTEMYGGSVYNGEPKVRQHFQGSRLWFSPLQADATRVRAWIDVERRTGGSEIGSRMANARNPRSSARQLKGPVPVPEGVRSPLELPRTDARGGRALVDLEPGHWHLAFVDPEVRDGEALAVALRVRVIEP